MSIGEIWTNFNAKVDTFVNTAEAKIGQFNAENPKIAQGIKIITGIALSSIALWTGPLTAGAGFAIGAAAAIVFPYQVGEMKERVLEFYDSCSGLGKIALLTAGAVLPLVSSLGFGAVVGTAAVDIARDYI